MVLTRRLPCLVRIWPLIAAWPSAQGLAAEIHLRPGGSFETAVEALSPGDTLVIHAGTYSGDGRVSIGVQGTEANPVLIQGAPGESRPLITRAPGDTLQNTINIEGARYLTIRGLEISGNGGDGINLNSAPSHITLEDLDIHDIDVGINFRSDMDNIIVRRNHIYRTGANGGTGEGMYVGCNYATCAVRNTVIENNWIHDTLSSTQGDGIEIKRGSHSNIIRDNVIHDTNYPCILLYGTEGNPRNLVEGNVVWNCGDSGIQVAADSLIRNNIVISNSSNGLNSQPHQEVIPANLEIIHNTFLGGAPCLRMHGWDGRPNMVFANNAVYCQSDNFRVDGMSGVTVAGNVLSHTVTSFPAGGYILGRGATLDFLAPSDMNLYPTQDSTLIGAGAPAYTTERDFDYTERAASVDAGAYAWTTPNNPGWAVASGFKGYPAGPVLELLALPDVVQYQQSSLLQWTSTGTASCQASGAWTGTRSPSGSESTGPLSAAATYTLSCATPDGQTIVRSVTVRVADTASPLVTLNAEPSVINQGENVTLSWSSENAVTCIASGGWAGTKPTAGSEASVPINANTEFHLTCENQSASATGSVTVVVREIEEPGGPSGGGGGILWLLLCLLPFAPRKEPLVKAGA